ADDKKFEQLITARNAADAPIHATRKTLEEAGDKVDAGEKASVESAISELEEARKSGEVDQIEAKTKALTDASSNRAQKMYAQQQGSAQPDNADAQGSTAGDDAVDAEFEEVKDDK